LAYRASKAVRDAPLGFDDFQPSKGSRSAGEILAHMCDLMDWALTFVKGTPEWKTTKPTNWNEDLLRFFSALEALDAGLLKQQSPQMSLERIFQGPVADALTHVGQLAMLRGMAGFPAKGENFFVADITIGRVGQEQAAAVQSF
jgi:hypothetical protein